MITNPARWATAGIGAAVAMIVWIITGYADALVGALLVPLFVAIVCFVIGPPIVEALADVDLTDD